MVARMACACTTHPGGGTGGRGLVTPEATLQPRDGSRVGISLACEFFRAFEFTRAGLDFVKSEGPTFSPVPLRHPGIGPTARLASGL